MKKVEFVFLHCHGDCMWDFPKLSDTAIVDIKYVLYRPSLLKAAIAGKGFEIAFDKYYR